jgi:hypothetical protein
MLRRLVAAVAVLAAIGAVILQLPTQLDTGSKARLPLAAPGVEGSIIRLARAVEGDGADNATIDYWVGRYRDGQSLQAIGAAFVEQPDFVKAYGKGTDADFVDRLYQHVLGRKPEAEERQQWVGRLTGGASRAALLLALTESDEYVRRTHTAPPRRPRRLLAPPGVEHSVARLYLAFTGHWPTDRELDADVQRYLDGTPLAEIADGLLTRPESKWERFRRASSQSFVESMYLDVLGRAPDPVKAKDWRARLDAGTTRGAVAVEFTESAEMLARTHTAAPLPAPVPHKLFAMGDSVMKGAIATIEGITDWEVHVDARGCRQPTTRGDGCGDKDIPSGLDALRGARDDGRLGGAVVILIGNNGPMSAEQFDSMMRLVSDQRLVYALTLHEPRRFEAPNNAVITGATARWPNLRIIDWHTFATGKDDYFSDGEGIHLSHEGAQAMADLIAASLPNY